MWGNKLAEFMVGTSKKNVVSLPPGIEPGSRALLDDKLTY